MSVATANANSPGQKAGAALDPRHLQDLIAAALAQADGEGSAEDRLRQIQAILRPASSPARPAEALTELQGRILQYLSQGLSNRLIAKRLAVREDAVKCQVRALLDRLNVPNRTALALWAIRTGVVPLHG